MKIFNTAILMATLAFITPTIFCVDTAQNSSNITFEIINLDGTREKVEVPRPSARQVGTEKTYQPDGTSDYEVIIVVEHPASYYFTHSSDSFHSSGRNTGYNLTLWLVDKNSNKQINKTRSNTITGGTWKVTKDQAGNLGLEEAANS